MSEIEDPSKEPGTIIEELQAGYRIHGRLLRPAFVGVVNFSTKSALFTFYLVSGVICAQDICVVSLDLRVFAQDPLVNSLR